MAAAGVSAGSARSGCAALVLAAGLAAASPAAADDWEFAIAPYLWAAGMEGEMATLPPAPAAQVDIGFDDILENLDMAFMGMGEIRHGRFALAVDVIYVDLSHDASTPGPFFSGAELDSETFVSTLQGSYRVLAAEQGHLDLRAGARIWSVSTELDLDAGLLAARERDDSETWVDPVVGFHGQARLGAGFYLTAMGNVGGFGAGSDLTWDLFGGLGYQVADWFAPVVGYRHLSVDYDRDGFLFDVDMSGPLIGGVIRF
jgi:hypothetical protein